MDNSNLIDQLCDELEPKPVLASPMKMLLIWSAIVYPISWALMYAIDIIRPNGLEHLTTSLRFQVEWFAGLAISPVAAYAAFHLARPSQEGLNFNWHWLPFVIAGFFVGTMVFGLIWPAPEVSLDGKRVHCSMETFIYGLWPSFIGVWIMREGFHIRPIASSVLLGIASGSLPVMMMHIGCRYEPLHIIIFHLLPGIAAATAVSFASYHLLKILNPVPDDRILKP